MHHIPPWLLVLIILNVAIFLIVLNPSTSRGIPSIENNIVEPVKTNQTTNQTKNQSANQTFNDAIYISKCLNSISNYIKNVENITNYTKVESRFFNMSENATTYARNWSTNSFEMIGIGKDIIDLNKSVISVNDFKRKDGKNFRLPIVCNENGALGEYSSCALANISNITFYCHNLTVSLSECDIEKMQYDFWEDINYWITPKPGILTSNISQLQLFNFTITSSRNRLEYASLYVWYRRPGIDQNLFNKSVATIKGDKISISTKLNITGKTFGGLILETYFKKKCYKYDLLTQYMY